MRKTKMQIQQPMPASSHPIKFSVVFSFVFAALLPVFILGFLGLNTPRASAQFTDEFDQPYGGFIVGYLVAAVVTPVSYCPAHVVVANSVPAGPPLIGLYVDNQAIFHYYYTDVFDGATLTFFPPALPPTSAVIGKYTPVPFPGCPLVGIPYPVFPMSTVNQYYYIGSSLTGALE